jgi:hypothetical protein
MRRSGGGRDEEHACGEEPRRVVSSSCHWMDVESTERVGLRVRARVLRGSLDLLHNVDSWLCK